MTPITTRTLKDGRTLTTDVSTSDFRLIALIYVDAKLEERTWVHEIDRQDRRFANVPAEYTHISGKFLLKADEYTALETEFLARKTSEIQARLDAQAIIAANCPADCVPATQNWSNGDLCSAEYEYQGIKFLGADMQKNQGEGIYFVPRAAFQAAKAKLEADTIKAEAAQIAADANRTELIAKAAATGKPQVLESELVNGRDGFYALETLIDASGKISQARRVVG